MPDVLSTPASVCQQDGAENRAQMLQSRESVSEALGAAYPKLSPGQQAACKSLAVFGVL